jgi:hypothetical protein
MPPPIISSPTFAAAQLQLERGGCDRRARVCHLGERLTSTLLPEARHELRPSQRRHGLFPIIAAAGFTSPELDEKLRAYAALRREHAIKFTGITNFVPGAVGMSPSIRSKFAWSSIHIYTTLDWALWQTLAYKLSGLAQR